MKAKPIRDGIHAKKPPVHKQTGGNMPAVMQYQIFRVLMPDPRAAGLPTNSTGPSSGPELVNGYFHVISQNGLPADASLATLAGPDVRILDLESQRAFTQSDVQGLGPQSRQSLIQNGYVTDLLPDYSTAKPFQK